MTYFSNSLGRTDMLAWLSLQGDDVKDYDEMSDDELRVLYEERVKTSDDYIDDYKDPLKQMSKSWNEDKKL
jgi:hypothetical protein